MTYHSSGYHMSIDIEVTNYSDFGKKNSELYASGFRL